MNIIIFFKSYLLKNKFILFISFLTGIASILFEFINPLFFRYIIDNILISAHYELLNNVIVILLIIFAISIVSSYYNSYLSWKLKYRLYKDISNDSFNNIINSNMKKFNSFDIGDLISRILYNTDKISDLISQTLLQIVINLLLLIIPIYIMLNINILLTFIIISPCVLFIFLNLYLGKRIDTYSTTMAKINGELSSFLKEYLSILTMIRLFNITNWINNKFNIKNNQYYDSALKSNKIISCSSSISYLFYSINVLLILIIGSNLVINKQISLGSFVAFLSYSSMFFNPLINISHFYTQYKSTLPLIRRLNKFNNAMPIENKNELDIIDGTIKISNIYFSYNNESIIKNFSATFTKGINYICGDNGTGKSTLIHLINGLYGVDKGIITIDNQPVNTLSRDSLNSNISNIFPEPYLFNDTIIHNICLDKTYLNIEEICDLVKLSNFINTVGYNYKIGENGNKLSSGESQKIALARALIRDTHIMIFDEATKSIDDDTRKIIKDIINTLKYDKTVIIITHNVNDIVKNANIVYLH
ncbi:MAG: ABC transporter ATP-binding protein/permease [Methanobrevibacter sp.]|jgi:ABC-type bacteriocin/lantibiotic exporter with double-glycine peptidase domain|nr:ABC transporter ATP-binding protein/permease [Methanobrevibacter sp.]